MRGMMFHIHQRLHIFLNLSFCTYVLEMRQIVTQRWGILMKNMENNFGPPTAVGGPKL
jgi:hypothetical protein